MIKYTQGMHKYQERPAEAKEKEKRIHELEESAAYHMGLTIDDYKLYIKLCDDYRYKKQLVKVNPTEENKEAFKSAKTRKAIFTKWKGIKE